MTWHSSPKTAVASKPHRCDACQRRIDPGERYERGFGVDGGDHWTWKWCAHCCALVAQGYIQEWDAEGITYDTFDGWAEQSRYRKWGPGDRLDWTEVRLAAGWRMRWRTQAGTLLPVPTRRLIHL